MHHFATFWALNRRQAAAKWHSHNFVFSSIGKRECFVTLFFPPCLYIYMYVPSHFGFGKATCFKFKSSYNDIETEPFHIHMYMYREAFFSTGKKSEMCYAEVHFIQKRMSVSLLCVAWMEKRNMIWKLWEKHSRFVMRLNEVTKCKRCVCVCVFFCALAKWIEDVTLSDI